MYLKDSNTIKIKCFTIYLLLNLFKMKIQTEIFNSSTDTTLLSTVEQKVSKLKNFFNRISEARVILKTEETGLSKVRIAEIKIQFPNGVIFIQESSRTFEVALDKAIVAIKWQLVQCKAKQPIYCLT